MKTHPPVKLSFPASRAAMGAIALTLVLLQAGSLWADEAQQVWLISTRHVCGCLDRSGPQPTLQYSKLTDDCRWETSDEAAFLASDDPAVPTCVFIHGNNETAQSAVQTGMMTFRYLTACEAGRPLRFVIWSWPSERVCRNLRADLQLKAARSDREGWLVAGVLDHVNPAVPVTLIGYSFGARSAAGALEILGGGQACGYRLAERSFEGQRPLQAVLVAAAMPNYWLLPGRREGLALSQAQSVLVTCNASDPVLRRYPRLYGRGGPEALGYTGPACPPCLGAERPKLDVLGVTCAVGRTHAWQGYLCSASLQMKMRQYTFTEAPPQTAQAEGLETVASTE